MYLYCRGDWLIYLLAIVWDKHGKDTWTRRYVNNCGHQSSCSRYFVSSLVWLSFRPNAFVMKLWKAKPFIALISVYVLFMVREIWVNQWCSFFTDNKDLFLVLSKFLGGSFRQRCTLLVQKVSVTTKEKNIFKKTTTTFVSRLKRILIIILDFVYWNRLSSIIWPRFKTKCPN